MCQTVLDRIEQFMATRQWDHNQHYHRWILRNAPRSIRRALDVGCGTGGLARLLATRARRVEAIDSDGHVIEQAVRATPLGTPVHYRHESLMNVRGGYTLITAVAVLHDLELAPALRCLRAALAPGGTLLVVGCYRAATTTDHLVDLAAVPANMALGSIKSSASGPSPIPSMTAPTRPPTTTLPEVRAIASIELPGVALRRALFWRYLLRYDAPGHHS